MIINLITVTTFAAAGEIDINIIYPTVAGVQKTSYTPGDTVVIRGTSPAKNDLVLRVLDNTGRLIHTDTLLAPANTGNYEFTFTLPAGPSAGNYDYRVAVGNQSYNATAVMKVNVAGPVVPQPPTGGGGGGTPAPAQAPAPVQPNGDVVNSTSGELVDELTKAKTPEEAAQLMGGITEKLESEQKQDPEILDKIANVVEAASGELSSQTANAINNTLNITDTSIDSQRISALEKTMGAIQDAISKNNIELNRELEKELVIKIAFDTNQKATIVIDPKVINALNGIDILTIADAEFRVSFPVAELKEQLADNEKLEIYLEKETQTLVHAKSPMLAGNNVLIAMAPSSKATQTAYRLSFNKDKLKNNVWVSLPSGSKENTQYQAVIKIDGSNQEVVGGKYNSITDLYDVPVQKAGTYIVRENKVDFSDIAVKDTAMQEAIRVLASKGIIEGSGAGNFSPDGTITRAEIAKLLVKTLYAQRSGEPFSDVKNNDWFKPYAESSRAAGIIKGLPGNIFAGNVIISKDQITVVAARTLVEKKKYKIPASVESYLQFADRGSIEKWAEKEVALASREGLVIKRVDNRFNGSSGMTRGEAALILKKLFDRL